jgi:cholesterol oxidase
MNNNKNNLQFSETMRGFWSVPKGDDYRSAAAAGKNARQTIRFDVTVNIADLHALSLTPDLSEKLTGRVIMSGPPSKGEDAFEIIEGKFQLFADSPIRNGKRMKYRIVFGNSSGKQMTLIGYKELKPSSVFHIWPDTTTLFTSIYEGRVKADEKIMSPPLYRGIMRISIIDFMKQLTTFRTGSEGFMSLIIQTIRFYRIFASSIIRIYIQHPQQSVTGEE